VKHDEPSEEVSTFNSKLQQWDAYSAQVRKLGDDMTAELDESYGREDTFARLLTFLKAREYRFSQSTSTEGNSKDVQGMTMALEQRGYGDVIWWINNGLTPSSIITWLTEDNAYTAAIQSEVRNCGPYSRNRLQEQRHEPHSRNSLQNTRFPRNPRRIS
jgi:hypothetical protein